MPQTFLLKKLKRDVTITLAKLCIITVIKNATMPAITLSQKTSFSLAIFVLVTCGAKNALKNMSYIHYPVEF